jgi:glycosyl transferase family 25
MTLPAYVIHLERAVARRGNAERLCQQLGPAAQIVPAVDGAAVGSVPPSKTHPFPSYPFSLRSSEIGAFMSHRACWQRILDEGHDAALVVEDDIELASSFQPALDLAMQHLTERAYVRFPWRGREKPRTVVATSGTTILFRPKVVGLGMLAQVVTRGAAERLLDATRQFDRPVDTYLQLFWDHGADMMSVWPSGVSEISANLGGTTIHARSGVLEKLRRETLRPAYRLALAFQSSRVRHDQ